MSKWNSPEWEALSSGEACPICRDGLPFGVVAELTTCPPLRGNVKPLLRWRFAAGLFQNWRKRHMETLRYVRRSAVLLALVSVQFGVQLHAAWAAGQESLSIKRLQGNPIIGAAMLPANDGENINGPSLIRVPAWIKNPLGKYYLYFAHHAGKYIRLAYANKLDGPWTVYKPGALRLADTPCDSIFHPGWASNKHVASPDVHVDDPAQGIRMYFHCPVHVSGPLEKRDSYQQLSLVATSKDGLHFVAWWGRLGNPYFRVFKWNGAYYALGMPGVFYRSVDGLQGFVKGPTLFTSDMRHSAVKVEGNTLLVFYSDVGDNPERILLSRMDLSRPWMEWKETKPVVVLEPQMEWEGSSLPAQPSVRGAAPGPVRQLRDPAIFVEAGRTYLLYSVAGESGIAIAEVHLP